MLGTSSALAVEMPARLQECAGIKAEQERLMCYDRLAESAQAGIRERSDAAPGTSPQAFGTQAPSPQPQAGARMRDSGADTSILARHWELDPGNKRGIFIFRPHLDNYLVATYNPSPNSAPYRPFQRLEPDADLSRTELAYQLGFKLKLIETPFDSPADLWFAYTQHSFWQAGNQEASSPFRETNY